MEALKKQRATTKSAITRAKTFVDGITPESVITIQELRVRVSLLENVWTEYQNIQHKIIELANEDQLEAEEQDYADIETKFIITTSKLVTKIDDLESNTSTESTSSQNNGTGSSAGFNGSTQPSITKADVKLPRMDLPNFSGEQLEWESFRDLFTSIVHNNMKISESQKLHYLKNALQGDAKVILKSLDITDANYAVAWDTLKERFENKRQLIHCHLKCLFSQPIMNNECSSQLRKLIDSINQHVRALKGLGLETDSWDPIVVFLLTDKLDSESRKQWELNSPGKTFPLLEDLLAFLDQRCRALEVTSTSRQKTIQRPFSQQQYPKQTMKTHHSAQSKLSCPLCKSQHQIYQCGEFMKLDIKSRFELAKKNRLCTNCLRANHTLTQCKSDSTCRVCNGKHNSLLHFDRSPQQQIAPLIDSQEQSIASHHSNDDIGHHVLLKTALVGVEDCEGNMQTCRAFLDDGSQSSLITDNCVRRLGLRRTNHTIKVNGIGNSVVHPCGKVNFTMHSLTSPFSIGIRATILKNLTGHLPQEKLNVKSWTHLHNLTLADCKFNEPSQIDILLGADVYEHILTDGKIAAGPGIPIARRSHLGWVISGAVTNQHIEPTSPRIHIATIEVADQLRKFWELEELSQQQHLTQDEIICESAFQEKTERNSDGRFTVSIPFKSSCKALGLSKTLCTNRLYSVERRLEKHPHYKQQYQAFMDEYLSLGHMEPVPINEQAEVSTQTNYLPHHFVLKEASTTTSLRVVFDASAKTSTAVSLNDTMLFGPKLQDDLHTTLLRFRLYKYVFTADIAKMYRQIRVTPANANLQRILWRNDPSLPIQEYQLTTVTYGTASAPYLAVKTLQHLAKVDGHLFPLAKEATLNSFYVDDIMSGKNTLDEALDVQQQLIGMLRGGGFHLRKWSANHPILLERIPPEDRETSLPLSIHAKDSIKALGLHWNPACDYLFFKVNVRKTQIPVTKRSLLSDIARLFDPLGLLSPVIIKAKVLMQKLWLLGFTWDESLPDDIQSTWIEYGNQLSRLEELKIPRHVGGDSRCKYQIHGFSDASELGYSAVLYLRAECERMTTTHLLTSKTKVAPVKQVSIPRLELCGATLLARLLHKVKQTINLPLESSVTWTDSTITLDWISQHPEKWTTFVANRVSEVQTLTNPSSWRHVPSKDNPADCASRGLMPEELLNFQLWWNGPSWLALDEEHWPVNSRRAQPTCVEQKKVTMLKTLLTTSSPEWKFISQYSSLSKMVRLTAYCIRFLNNAKLPKPERLLSFLTTSELHHALISLIKYIQNREFSEAMHYLKKGMNPPIQLSSLNPFVHKAGVLRVGGRLCNANLKPDQKYPILLPKSHHLTKLIVLQEHVKQLHAGPQLVLAALNQRFWIINGRSLVRNLIHKCIRCARLRITGAKQQMGNLPPSRPFLKTGVDYAGPFKLKSMKGRGSKRCKCYISLFICLSTKAVHLELVTDLTSDAFIAALRRFASRRGKPSDVYSDNGTNFVGANSELQSLKSLLQSQEFNANISRSLSADGIMWHFSPAHAPHFGGIWEAAIKSTKRHLTRVIGEQILTFKEFYTWLTQIEACLNSRPLSPLSTNPNDFTPLTLGHFLIGEPLTSIPDPDLTEVKLNRLSRWQLIQQLNQHFWRRWHLEYLTQLQQRNKWPNKQPNLKIGDLVVIKDENTAPLRWPMGRIVEIHPGADQLVRAVTIKTVNGMLKRPIVKVCLLPIEQC